MNKSNNEDNIICPVDLRKMKQVCVIEDHTNEIKQLLKLPDGRLASCSIDCTLKIFNPEDDYHCDITMKHDNLLVSFDIFAPNKLVSADAYGKISFWRYDELTCQMEDSFSVDIRLRRIKTISNNRLAVCTFCNELQIWSSVPPYQKIKSLEADLEMPFNVFQPEGKEILLVVYHAGALIIWDLNTYEKLNQYGCSRFSEGFFQYDQNTIIYPFSCNMFALNLTDYTRTKLTNSDKNLYMGDTIIKVRDGRLLYDLESELTLYDPKTKSFEYTTVKIRNVPDVMVAIDDHHIATGGNEKNQIIIWEY